MYNHGKTCQWFVSKLDLAPIIFFCPLFLNMLSNDLSPKAASLGGEKIDLINNMLQQKNIFKNYLST
jgi:hypothetical protein